MAREERERKEAEWRRQHGLEEEELDPNVWGN